MATAAAPTYYSSEYLDLEGWRDHLNSRVGVKVIIQH
jgi:hypothetical protein